jgi:hypothetical protein
LRDFGDALEEAILFYGGINLNVQVSGVEILQEGGPYSFAEVKGLLKRDETW